MLDGCTRPSSKGSMTMRPASISDRIVLSLRTTRPRVYWGIQVRRSGADTRLQRMRNVDGNGEQTHYVKRVLLPSGKTIEVVYFREQGAVEEAVAAAPRRTEDAPGGPHQGLHVCFACAW